MIEKDNMGLPSRGRTELPTIQAGRAVAALLVVAFHTSVSIFALPKYFAYQPFGRFFNFAHAGVNYFFVLSGFLIFYVHREDIGVRGSVRSFAWKRAIRIYPIYWIVLTLSIPAYFFYTSFGSGHEREPLTILSSYLLVHIEGHGGILVVSWTLFFEMLFYTYFAMLIRLPRLGAYALVAWALGCSWTLWSTGAAVGLRDHFFTSPYNLLFMNGMLCAWLLRRLSIAYPTLLLFFGILLFLVAGIDEDFIGYVDESSRLILFGLGSAGCILGGVCLDERRGGVPVPKLVVFVGEASYSIYLVHFIALSILAKVFARANLNSITPPAISFVLLMFGAVLIGCLTHVWVERPLLQALRRRWRAHGSKPGFSNSSAIRVQTGS